MIPRSDIIAMYDDGLSMMRIAKIFDLRMSLVRAIVNSPRPPRIPKKDWGLFRDAQIAKQSAEANLKRKGKARPIAGVQATYAARYGAPVSLPKISFVEGK